MTPELIEGILAGLGVVGSWLGARHGGKKASDQLKPTNGDTTTIRQEIHLIRMDLGDVRDDIRVSRGDIILIRDKLEAHINKKGAVVEGGGCADLP